MPRGKIAALLMLIASEFDFLIAKREQLQRLGIFSKFSGPKHPQTWKNPSRHTGSEDVDFGTNSARTKRSLVWDPS